MGKEKVLLTLAARGGSKGVKNKNIRDLNGIPLIAHTIRQAIRWGKADRIICSTDSDAIASVAKNYGAEVPFARPAKLATDTASKLDVLRHALKTVEAQSAEQYPIVIDLDVTAPVRKISDIERAYQLFISKRPKSVFSVTPCRKNPYFNMVKVNAKGYAGLLKKPYFAVKSRQQAPKIYDMNASIYVYDRKYLLSKNTKSAISSKSLILMMDEFSAFDIDSEADFQFIEFLLSKGAIKL